MPDGQPDYAGYPDLDSLVKGYRSSSEEGKRQRDEAIRQKQRADMLEQQASQRQQVPPRGQDGRFQAHDPAARLMEYGVPVDALQEYTAQMISSAVANAFSPITQGIHARDRLMSEYQDYSQHEASVARFVNEDPDFSARYQKMFSSDPVGAMDYAFLKYGERARKQSSGNGVVSPMPQKIEAQIPSNRMGAGTAPTSDRNEVLAKAWERYQKTGDPTAFARARLRETISDEFLSK
jgi:hypothetical protein